jgi:purine-binding chemotaxis protein CheW
MTATASPGVLLLKLLTATLADQRIGFDVGRVFDVIRLGTLTPVPLAPRWIAGVMNLRGRIVTAIDLRARFGLPSRNEGAEAMCIVVDFQGERYGLVIDDVGDVVDVDKAIVEANPPTMPRAWQQVSTGVARLDPLIVIVDVDCLIDIPLAAAA